MMREIIGCMSSQVLSLLLMHFDGSNGGTVFTDSSIYNRAVTASGNVNTSTTQKKFGTASAYFDGSGDFLYGSYSNLALGAGDFTVDFWIYPTEARDQSLFETRIRGGASNQPNSIALFMLSARTLQLQLTSGGGTTTATVTLNTWSHIAIVRSGSTINLYINGTSVLTVTSTLNFNVQGLTIGVAADAAGPYFKGYYDELRILSGVALWTGNFTPPTAASSI
jgi:hypothetical protein